MLRIEEIIKDRKISKPELAGRMGLSKHSLYARLNAANPSLDTLKRLSGALDCEIQELFETSEAYAHWYDKGEWLGIRKRYPS